MISKILILFLLGSGFSAHAFINIETLRIEPLDGFTGNLDLTGQFQSGNTDKNILNFSSSNRYHSGEHEVLAIANYRYGESFNKKDTHRGSAHLRYAKELSELLIGELFAQIEFDEFKSLNQRDLFGVSSRFRLINEERFFLFSGLGFFAESEQLKSDTNQENFRGNIYLSGVYKTEQALKASLVVYFQPLWDTLVDHRLNLDFDIESPIYKTLSLVFSYDYQFDNRPPSNVKKYDSTALVGVRWSI